MRIASLATLVSCVGGVTLVANPIRKVVNMLQSMQAKVEKEGAEETALYNKFMCYCKNSGGDLQESIATAKAKIPEITSALEEAQAAQAGNGGGLDKAKADRGAALQDMKEATSLRKKEAAAFAHDKKDTETNVAALGGAISALEKGMGGFLQTRSAQVIKRLAITSSVLSDSNRDEVVSFLTGSSSYAPAGGEIVGILKTMHDEMSAALAAATATEDAAIKSFEGLIASKKKEVAALTKKIEASIGKNGDLGVQIVNLQNDLEDTKDSLAADQKFVEQLENGCKTKTGEYEAHQKTRGEELVALAETIKVLNDDDALELFKKTLPSASSLMQLTKSQQSVRQQALRVLRKSKRSVHLDLVLLALHGKKIGFGKVIAMIDEMVGILHEEQSTDDAEKDYCLAQFDSTEDKIKGLHNQISDLTTSIANDEETLDRLSDEIKALLKGIAALDASVAEATAQRKAQNAEYKELMATDSATKDLLNFAKNRLNKFYNPKLYAPPPERKLDAEDTIVDSFGGQLDPTAAPGGIAGTGISAMQASAQPPPPPKTGSYKKSTQASAGVIAMIDLLIADVDKEMQEAKVEEADAQKDYDGTMVEAAAKRAEDSKAADEKKGAKAELSAGKASKDEEKAAKDEELMSTDKYLGGLHGRCDWLLKHFNTRAEARTGEIESLKNGKAVLSGADYSLMQVGNRKLNLRGGV